MEAWETKAILEIEVPESCKQCELWRYCLNDKKLILYADMRNPDCPLQIVEDFNKCLRCGKVTAIRFYGLCRECNKYIDNYDCKKEAQGEGG